MTELCRIAEINRATFYKHYLDVPDLMEKLENELFDRIRAASGSDVGDLYVLLGDMVNTEEMKRKYMLLGGRNGDSELAAKTFRVCYDSIYPVWERNVRNLPENERQMLYYYLTHGAEGVLKWWFQDGMKASPEAIARYIMDASGATVTGMREMR